LGDPALEVERGAAVEVYEFSEGGKSRLANE
jgi:hypothetical protein